MKISKLAQELQVPRDGLVRLAVRLRVFSDETANTVDELDQEQVDKLRTAKPTTKKEVLEGLTAEERQKAVPISRVLLKVADDEDTLSEKEAAMLVRGIKKTAELGISVPIGLEDEELLTRLIVEVIDWAKTPAREKPRPRVAVFGAGIAGLTAAHELAERGFEVTIFEAAADDRPRDPTLPRNLNTPHPPVKLGGMAASQYAQRGEPSHFMYQGRPDPLEQVEIPDPPGPHFPGEHGFRFFPAYYMHLWDMLQRIPIYEARVVPKGLEDFQRISAVLDGGEVERLIREVPLLDALEDSMEKYAAGNMELEELVEAVETDYLGQKGRVGSLRRRVDDIVPEGDRRESLSAKLDEIEKARIDEALAEVGESFHAFIGDDNPNVEVLRIALRKYARGPGTRAGLLALVEQAIPEDRRDLVVDIIAEVYVGETAEGEDVPGARADIRWIATDRTVYDNVNRIVTQASTTTDGRPTLIFPREAPRTFAEMVGAVGQFRDLGFSPQDLQTFSSRLARYLVTSPLRRSLELEEMSAYDFFTGRDEQTGQHAYQYTAAFDDYLKDLPKVLAAFDAEWGDARTNIDTLLQLQLRIDRQDNKADGVLNGPTTTAWFDHWYEHLSHRMDVTFRHARLQKLKFNAGKGTITPEIEYQDPDDPEDPDFTYIVMATDAFTAEGVTADLRTAGVAGTVLELDGFTSTRPPSEPPRKLAGPVVDTPLGRLRKKKLKNLRKLADEAGINHDGLTRVELIDRLRPSKYEKRQSNRLREVGRRPWDRFQTLAGIQYYFDTEFQLARGHVYYSGSEWALSSINQAGLWEDQPILAEDQYVSILSVDIGDWNTPSMALADEDDHPHGKAAWQCTEDELAYEVWRQIGHALSNDRDRAGVQSFPEPVSYSLDQYLSRDEQGEYVNDNPYLVPIVGDWANRPGGYPWDPHGTSVAYVREPEDRQIHTDRHVWMAEHGGYEVHCDQLVFAGTWTKTFTRMTTMEAACESGRHAVNAILDHWVWKKMEERGLNDPRRAETVGLDWRWPFGFVDADGSFPVRQPSPAGDYCFIFDIENREPADFRPTRVIDERFADRGLPHPWEAQGTDSVMAAMGQGAIPMDPTMPLDPFSPGYLRWVIQHMKNWRILLEALNKITDPKTGETITFNDPLGAKKVDTAPPGWKSISPTSGRVPTGAEEE